MFYYGKLSNVFVFNSNYRKIIYEKRIKVNSKLLMLNLVVDYEEKFLVLKINGDKDEK